MSLAPCRREAQHAWEKGVSVPCYALIRSHHLVVPRHGLRLWGPPQLCTTRGDWVAVREVGGGLGGGPIGGVGIGVRRENATH
jgi:hypothetical protein